jgi:hypothetical protein
LEISYSYWLANGQRFWQTSHKAAPGVSQARSRIEHYYEAYAEANLLLASQPSPLPKRVIYYFQSWNTHILSGNK